MDQHTKMVTLPEPKNLNIHQWTNEEKVFKRKERILEEIKGLDITFQSVLLYKLGKSVFGSFLKELNVTQAQDNFLNNNKLAILNFELKRYNTHDLNIVSDRNYMFKDYYNLLKTAVSNCDVIDLGFLEGYLESLSLKSCFIKEVDRSLSKFHNMQVLALSGNYIKDISGSCLPRNLKFLELFDNLIGDLKRLLRHIPKTILHLGLGRNKLTNDSSLHLLANRENLKHLKSLDLSDNDICDLKALLNSIKEMKVPKALSLEGNPCWVTPGYKTEVLLTFPDIQYLDFTQVLQADTRNLNNNIPKNVLPQIIFYCYKIMGLQEPPKDTKNTQVYYLEVNFPLLIENPIEKQLIEMPNEIDTNDKNETASNITKESSKKSKGKSDEEKGKKKKPEKNAKEKKEKKKSYFSSPDEYNEKFEKYNIWFKTERISWSKLMEFPPMFVNAPENSLTAIRDTFRSIVPVRLIYLKTAPFVSKQKKEKGKKDKNVKNTAKEELNTTSASEQDATEEQPTETVLKKVTVASFYCDLKCLNWSDDTMDFYWSQHVDVGDHALRINGSLKAVEYDAQVSLKKENNVDGPKKEAIPNVLTCLIGFGIKRFP